MKIFSIGLAAIVLCTGFVGGRPATADDVATPAASAAHPAVPARRLAWLPLHPIERFALLERHPRLVGRLGALAGRADKYAKQLEDKKLESSARAKIEAQQAATDAEAAEALAALFAVERPATMTDEVLLALAKAPAGPHDALRHAMRLAFVAPRLEPQQEALLAHVFARVEGALLAMATLSQHGGTALGAGEGNAEENAARVRRNLDQYVRGIERRWWQLADCVLDGTQRATWFRAVPPQWQEKADALEHIYDLPGLEPSQGTRVIALLTELESESAPEQATQVRLRQALSPKDLDAGERKRLRKELDETDARLRTIGIRVAEETKALFTPDQLAAWYAIPPRLTGNDRRERPERVLEGLHLLPGQAEALAALRVEYAGRVAEFQKDVREIQSGAAEYGPDSPQMMDVMMQMAGVRGTGASLGREALGRVFLDILEPDQVARWTLGEGGRLR